MDYEPVIMYVNDKYFGIINLREKINKEYLGNNHNATKKTTELLELSGGSSKEYAGLLNFIAQNYLSKDFPSELEKQMDIENYFNYSFVICFYCK